MSLIIKVVIQSRWLINFILQLLLVILKATETLMGNNQCAQLCHDTKTEVIKPIDYNP